MTDLRYRSTHHTTHDSRPIGRRGEKRRQDFLQALEKVAEYTPWRRVTVAILATEVECSPATFYQYWTSLEEAAWELVETKREAATKSGRKLETINRRWAAIGTLLGTEDW